MLRHGRWSGVKLLWLRQELIPLLLQFSLPGFGLIGPPHVPLRDLLIQHLGLAPDHRRPSLLIVMLPEPIEEAHQEPAGSAPSMARAQSWEAAL